MITSVKYDFCEFSIYDNFIIAVMREGITVLPEHNQVLIELAERFYGEKPFAYITNRINSYSVDTRVYKLTSEINNLAAFAVVSQYKVSLANTEIEKMFLKKPVKSFTKLVDAIEWSKDIIEAKINQ